MNNKSHVSVDRHVSQYVFEFLKEQYNQIKFEMFDGDEENGYELNESVISFDSTVEQGYDIHSSLIAYCEGFDKAIEVGNQKTRKV